MPTYDYRCKECSHEFEHFQSIKSDALTMCPQCSKDGLERLIGPGAALLFKGSGFYLTDYRSESYRSAAKKDGGSSSSGGETKTSGGDSKPAASGASSGNGSSSGGGPSSGGSSGSSSSGGSTGGSKPS